MTDHHRSADQQIGRGERWVSLLGGPLAAGAQLALSVPLLPLSCLVEWRTIFHLVSLVAALAALGAGMLAWQRLQEQRVTGPPARRGPFSRGYVPLIVNALALVMIGVRWFAVLAVELCAPTL